MVVVEGHRLAVQLVRVRGLHPGVSVASQVAVALVITGPGVTNSLTALADAYLDSVPMVLLASQVARERRGRGAFHELKDQAAALAREGEYEKAEPLFV